MPKRSRELKALSASTINEVLLSPGMRLSSPAALPRHLRLSCPAEICVGVQQPIRHHRRGTESHARGVVDNESDKNIANIRANGVSGVFAVTNNLQVVKN